MNQFEHLILHLRPRFEATLCFAHYTLKVRSCDIYLFNVDASLGYATVCPFLGE